MVSELDTGRCASKEARPRRGGGGLGGGPTSIGEMNKCQRERWAMKGGGLLDPTSVGEENETLL